MPHFFNISLCGPLASQCNDSQVCYSEHLQTYYNLGRAGSCNYEYDSVARQVRFTFEYSTDLVFGTGNVTVTLVCGRTLVSVCVCVCVCVRVRVCVRACVRVCV